MLESLAFNVVARIDDLLYVDDLTKNSEKMSPAPKASPMMTHMKKKASSVSRPTYSPSPARGGGGDRTPFLHGNGNNAKTSHRRVGLGVRRVLTNYLGGVENKPAPSTKCGKENRGGDPIVVTNLNKNKS